MVWVVIGQTGVGSDTKEWLVAAYRDEDKAIHHMRRASLFAIDLMMKYQREELPEQADGEMFPFLICDAEDIPQKYRNPFDDKMEIWGRGIEYTIAKVDYRTELPEERK